MLSSVYRDFKDEIGVKIDDSIYWDVDSNIGAEVGRGNNSGVYIYDCKILYG